MHFDDISGTDAHVTRNASTAHNNEASFLGARQVSTNLLLLLIALSFAKGMKKSMNLRRFCKTKPLSASFPLKNFNPFYELYIFYKFFCLLVWASEEERVDA